MTTLNTHAPRKKRYIRTNNDPFMNSTLCKAILVRSKLRNKFLKSKTSESRDKYKRQRNYCVSLLRKIKQNYYKNLNVEVINDNKTFWKNIKPLFSDKTPINNKITLIEDNDIISDDRKCAELMNMFFSESILQ